MITLIFAAMAAISQHQMFVTVPNHAVVVYAEHHGYRCALATPAPSPADANHRATTWYHCYLNPTRHFG